MKPLLSLLAIITLSIFAWQVTPHVKTQSSAISTRIESPQPAETVNVPPQKETPVVEPVKQPVPEAPKPVVSGDCSLAYNYDWPQPVAHAVCMAESTNNVNAVNMGDNHKVCIGSFSLMQVACFWYPYYGYSEADYYNPQVNMQIAYNIWKRQGGFQAWSAYTTGKYLRYL